MKYKVVLSFGVSIVIFATVLSLSLQVHSPQKKVVDYRQSSPQSSTNPHQPFSKSLREKLQEANVLGNLENTYSSQDIQQGEIFAFPEVGLQRSINNIAGVRPIAQKNQILYLNADNFPVAVIGFCFYKHCNPFQNIEEAKILVEVARKKAKIVVILTQIGAEINRPLHLRNQTKFFYGENQGQGNFLNFNRAMIDAGADLVLGNGAYGIGVTKTYQEKLIVYTLGNFLGYQALSTSSQKGDLLIIDTKSNSHRNVIW